VFKVLKVNLRRWNIFSQSKNGALKVRLGIFREHSIQTSVVKSHTTTHQRTATPDNPAQLEFNCSGHSDFYNDLHFVRLLLRIKVVNTGAADVTNAESNRVSCIDNVLHLMFSSLGVLWNGKPVTIHVTSYHYKAYLEKLLHYGGTKLISSFWFLDSAATDGSHLADKTNTGYVTRWNYLNESYTIDRYGRFRADSFNSGKMLISGVVMNIKLTLALKLSPRNYYWCKSMAYSQSNQCTLQRYSFSHSNCIHNPTSFNPH
jgi:hypothetical protein